jgi:hypothetical protein
MTDSLSRTLVVLMTIIAIIIAIMLLAPTNRAVYFTRAYHTPAYSYIQTHPYTASATVIHTTRTKNYEPSVVTYYEYQ